MQTFYYNGTTAYINEPTPDTLPDEFAELGINKIYVQEDNFNTFKNSEIYADYKDILVPWNFNIFKVTSTDWDPENNTNALYTVDGGGSGSVEELPYEIVQPTDDTHCDKLIAASGWKFIGSQEEITTQTLLVLKFKEGYDYNDYFVNISRNDNKKGSIQYNLNGTPAGQPDNSIDYTSSSTPKPAFLLTEYSAFGNGLGVLVMAPIADNMQGLDFNYCILRFFGAVVANTTNFRMIKY